MSLTGDVRPGLGGFNIDPRVGQLVEYGRASRAGDMREGEEFGNRFFGANNPDMKRIIDARMAAAFGTDPTVDLQRAQGVNNINQTMQTATRGLMSRLASSGVRGGAAGGAAIPIARDALNARQGLETSLAINEQKRRDAALGALESTLTGERSGLLSSIFGFAGLGAQDRGNAQQTVLGQDYIKAAQQAFAGLGGGGAPSFSERLSKDPSRAVNQSVTNKILPNSPEAARQAVIWGNPVTGAVAATEALTHPENWKKNVASWTGG